MVVCGSASLLPSMGLSSPRRSAVPNVALSERAVKKMWNACEGKELQELIRICEITKFFLD